MARFKGDALRVIHLVFLVTPFVLHVSLAQNCGSQGGGALCQSGYCCSKFGYCGNTNDYCGTGNCQSQCPSSSPSGSGVGSIVTPALFDQIFPNRNTFYTYDSFISAANFFSNFGTTGDSTAKAQEISAFFAHVSHETSGLLYINEQNPPQNSYCSPSNTQYPCGTSGQQYYGRGPLQISWNYNYGPAGVAIGQDLLNDPDLVAQNPTISFETALWFWITQQSPKPSCHDVMVGNWVPSSADVAAGREPGFGETIDIINGGFECGPSASYPAEAANRVSLYKSICGTLGVAAGNNVDCTNMQHY